MVKKVARFIPVAFVVSVVLIVFALPGVANAWLFCRSDPTVILSNGMALDLGATISTLPTQVQEVHYELHVPTGLSMILAIHTPTWLTSQETFTFYADQPAGQYQVTTSAVTSEGDATVVADTILVSVLGIKLGHYSVSGLEGQLLSLAFHS